MLLTFVDSLRLRFYQHAITCNYDCAVLGYAVSFRPAPLRCECGQLH